MKKEKFIVWPNKSPRTLYIKDPCEAKYQLLIDKRESTRLKHSNDSKVFTEYSNDIDHIYGKYGKIQFK